MGTPFSDVDAGLEALPHEEGNLHPAWEGLLHLGELFIALVAQLGIALGGDEELLIYIFSIFTGIRSLWHFGLLGEHYGSREQSKLACFAEME